MRNAPTAELLLSVALETYKRDVLPHLPSEARYSGAMIANALGIAARQSAEGEGFAQDAREALAALSGLGEGEALATIEQSVCADIRRGRYDAAPNGVRSQSLHAALVALTRAKAAESCPKALAVPRHDLCPPEPQA
jgi:hypothetical protein